MPTPVRRTVAAPFRIVGVSPPLLVAAIVFAFLFGAVAGAVLAAVLGGLAAIGLAAWASQREPHVDILIGERLRRAAPLAGRAVRGFPPARTVRIWPGGSNRYDP